jgi:hypothetical protein
MQPDDLILNRGRCQVGYESKARFERAARVDGSCRGLQRVGRRGDGLPRASADYARVTGRHRRSRYSATLVSGNVSAR